MLKYIISFCFFWSSFLLFSQDKTVKTADSIKTKTPLELRIGADISKPITGFFDSNYKAIELVADLKISKKFYIASEFGQEDKKSTADFFSYQNKGQFLKIGFDYNTHKNWYGLDNMVYTGLRYGYGRFSQQTTSYSIYNPNTYWQEDNSQAADPSILTKNENLQAHWVEAVVGFKAEVLSNLYVGISARLGKLIHQKQNTPSNLYIPGFGKVTQNSTFGASYNYTISYRITLF